jgi:hypothetical protein
VLRRRYRTLTALVALCSVLFTQLAIAAYICPGIQSGQNSSTTAANPPPMQSMPGCDQLDPADPALCLTHCQDGNSSLDRPDVPVVSPPALIVSSILPTQAPPLAAPGQDPEPDSLLLRITSPPISIRHCCFRI